MRKEGPLCYYRLRPICAWVAYGLLATLCGASLAQSNSTIQGSVREAITDRPLENVKVSVISNGLVVKTVATDGKGIFRVSDLPSGRYRLLPTRDGFVFSHPRPFKSTRELGVWIQVASSEDIRNIQLQMFPSAAISGRVIDEDGNPVSNKAVSLMRFLYDEYGQRRAMPVADVSYRPTGVPTVRTNDEGQYRLYDLPPGTYYIYVAGGLADRAGHRLLNTYYPGMGEINQAQPVQVDPAEEIVLPPLVLRRAKAVRVRFHLIEPEGESIFGERSLIGQTVSWGPSTGFIRGPDPPEVIGNRDEFIIPALTPGHYDFHLELSSLLLQTRRNRILYGEVSMDVGDSEIDRDVPLRRGFHLTGSITMEDELGRRFPDGLGTVRCKLRSDAINDTFAIHPCLTSDIPPGLHRVEMEGMPRDAYLLSATISKADVIRSGFELTGDANLEIVIGTSGGLIEGVVRGANDEKLPDSIVALVPDPPLRDVGPLYRSGISDVNGKFELRGIAPGLYHIFAWADLEGAAFRNAEFMKGYEGKGKPVKVEKGAKLVMDITSFN